MTTQMEPEIIEEIVPEVVDTAPVEEVAVVEVAPAVQATSVRGNRGAMRGRG